MYMILLTGLLGMSKYNECCQSCKSHGLEKMDCTDYYIKMLSEQGLAKEGSHPYLLCFGATMINGQINTPADKETHACHTHTDILECNHVVSTDSQHTDSPIQIIAFRCSSHFHGHIKSKPRHAD